MLIKVLRSEEILGIYQYAFEDESVGTDQFMSRNRRDAVLYYLRLLLTKKELGMIVSYVDLTAVTANEDDIIHQLASIYRADEAVICNQLLQIKAKLQQDKVLAMMVHFDEKGLLQYEKKVKSEQLELLRSSKKVKRFMELLVEIPIIDRVPYLSMTNRKRLSERKLRDIVGIDKDVIRQLNRAGIFTVCDVLREADGIYDIGLDDEKVKEVVDAVNREELIFPFRPEKL